MSVSFYAVDQTRPVVTPNGYIVPTMLDIPTQPNFANANARLILNFLGISEDMDLVGECPLDEFYAALQVADIFFVDEGVKFTRDREQDRNWISFEFTESDLKYRIEILRKLYDEARVQNATHICWS